MMTFELDDLKMPEELKQWVRSQIASGRYASETDLVVAALTLQRDKLKNPDPQ